jgi:predicted XRE-type DNA-binding protein
MRVLLDECVPRALRKLKMTRGCGNVFSDLGFDKAEADNLKLRAELMICIEDHYRKNGMAQSKAEEVLGLTQPRFNALLKGKIGVFSLDALVNIANRAGLNVRLVISKVA